MGVIVVENELVFSLGTLSLWLPAHCVSVDRCVPCIAVDLTFPLSMFSSVVLLQASSSPREQLARQLSTPCKGKSTKSPITKVSFHVFSGQEMLPPVPETSRPGAMYRRSAVGLCSPWQMKEICKTSRQGLARSDASSSCRIKVCHLIKHLPKEVRKLRRHGPLELGARCRRALMQWWRLPEPNLALARTQLRSIRNDI